MKLPCNEEDKLLPVMFFIHGGAFITGSSNSNEFGPEYLIDKNVVLVATNYRLHIFGFLNAMEETAPGNVGLKDQLAALQWVQKNIKQFNGDPKRVTVFGHSAGSVSISYHLQSKLSQGLFHNAIMLSGCSLNKWTFERNPLEVLHKLGNVLNIDSKNITEIVDKLRNISSRELLDIIEHPALLNLNQSVLRFRFLPSIEYNSSDALITEYSYSLLERNEIYSIPLIFGQVSNEAAILYDPNFRKIVNFNFSFFENNLNKLAVPLSLNIDNNKSTKNAVFNEIKNKYFSNNSISRNVAYANYLTDEEFFRGTRKTVDFLRKYNDIYFYIFDFKEQNINKEYTGITHGGELKYLFYSQEQHNRTNKKVINKMTTLWTNFAKTGNPTPIEDPALDDIKWPIVPRNPEEKMHHLVIRKKLRIVKDWWQKKNKFWATIFQTYGRKPFMTY